MPLVQAGQIVGTWIGYLRQINQFGVAMRTIDQMIAEQVNTWTKREGMLRAEGRLPGSGPVITISREFGACGAALAVELGERLGFEVWDRDLLAAISEKSGGDEKLLASLDERRRSAIEDAVWGALTGFQHTNTQYFLTLLRVVHTISTHGNCIIVGRAANYVSRDHAKTLHIRVVAPLEARVRNYAARQSISVARAQETVALRDGERADFVKHHFKRDIECPSDYDLVVNSDTFSLEDLADIVLVAFEAKLSRAASHDPNSRPTKQPLTRSGTVGLVV
jgi:cytidylate kinase